MNILIIYTGGTIGMVPSDKGWRPQPGYLEARIREHFRQQAVTADVAWLEYDPLLDSSQIQPNHWNQLAADLLARQSEFDGFVVLHGTDTMAYTASALTFMLRGLHKPVVITGSQIPVWESTTDGLDNALLALQHAQRSELHEVYLAFHGALYHGAHVTKANSERLKGFSAPHGVHLQSTPVDVKDVGEPRYIATEPRSIEVYHHLPGTPLTGLQALVDTRPQALIQLSYGAGNAPDSPQMRDILMQARDQNTLLINSSQCFRANVNMELYEAAAALREVGAVGTGTMTLEAVVAKLHVLFALYDRNDDVAHQLIKPWSQELPRPKP